MGGIHKGKNRKVIALMPPSRGRDTSPFALKQIFFSRKENPTDSQKTFSLASKQILFIRKKNPTDVPKNIPICFEANLF